MAMMDVRLVVMFMLSFLMYVNMGMRRARVWFICMLVLMVLIGMVVEVVMQNIQMRMAVRMLFEYGKCHSHNHQYGSHAILQTRPFPEQKRMKRQRL